MTKLKNKYSGIIVYTKDYNDVTIMGEMNFIRVYEEKNSERTYIANREAFEILENFNPQLLQESV